MFEKFNLSKNKCFNLEISVYNYAIMDAKPKKKNFRKNLYLFIFINQSKGSIII